MAPELLSKGAKPSKEADMYAFGMLVYEVIMGARPYLIQGSRPTKRDQMPAGFGQGTWEFAERCWDEDQARRPSAREALEHFGRVVGTSASVSPCKFCLISRIPVSQLTSGNFQSNFQPSSFPRFLPRDLTLIPRR